MKHARPVLGAGLLAGALMFGGAAPAAAQYGSEPTPEDWSYCAPSTGCALNSNGNRIDSGPVPTMTDEQRAAQWQCLLQFGAGGFGIAGKGVAAVGGYLAGGSALLGPCATFAGVGE